VPASVTADPERARAHAFETLGGYARNPSYQAILDREGIKHPAELALIGDEETVAAGIRRYLEAGATDIRVSPVRCVLTCAVSFSTAPRIASRSRRDGTGPCFSTWTS